MKKLNKKVVSFFIIFALIIGNFIGISNKVYAESKNEKPNINYLIDKTINYYNNDYFTESDGTLENWQYAVLVKAGDDLTKREWTKEETFTSKYDKNLSYFNSIVNQSLICLEKNQDPNNFNGRKLINEIAKDLEQESKYGLIDVEAVIAIDRYNKKYSKQKVDYDVDKQVENIINFSKENSNVRIRAYSLIALLNHKDKKGVKEEIKNIIEYIHKCEKDDGSICEKNYITGYHAEVVYSLILANEKLTSEKWTSKSGKNPIDALFKLYNTNGSFNNAFNESKNNKDWFEGTQKALYTLVELRDAGYSEYIPKDINENNIPKQIPEKKCNINITVVIPKGDGYEYIIAPKRVEVNNKVQKNGSTALGALEAVTKLYKSTNGYVSEIAGYEAKGNGGWMYSVNGCIPNVYANNYELNEGDKVIWYYSIDGMNSKLPSWNEIIKLQNKELLKGLDNSLQTAIETISKKQDLNYYDVEVLNLYSKQKYSVQFNNYIEKIKKSLKNKKDNVFTKNGEINYINLSKTIIGLTLAGQDAKNVDGMNLIDKLCETNLIERFTQKDNLKIENIAYALLALNSGNYTEPNNAKFTKQDLKNKLISLSRDDKSKYGTYFGGWKNSFNEGEPDKVLTGLVIESLSPYKEEKDVNQKLKLSVDCLSQTQGNDAGFGQMIGFGFKKYSEITSNIISSLCLININPLDDKFVKIKNEEKNNLIQYILKHKTKDGFSQKIGENEKTDEYSTAAAAKAFILYKNLNNIEKPNASSEIDSNEKPNIELQKKDYNKKVNEAIEGTCNYILKKEKISYWDIISLKQAKNDRQFNEVLNKNEEFFKSQSINEIDKFILSATLCGKDAQNINGVNVINYISKAKLDDFNDFYVSIYALLALDCGNYELPLNSNISREKLIDNILKSKLTDGGFAPYSNFDVDSTSMALIALSKYKDKDNIKDIIDKSIDKLSKEQDESGGYKSVWGNDYTSESVFQAIIALCSLGIDPTSSKFTKNNINLIDNLFEFKTQDGFSHIKNLETNDMSTYQGLQALCAYRNFKENKQPIYVSKDFSKAINNEKIEIKNLTEKSSFKLGEDAKICIKAKNNTNETQEVELIVGLFDSNNKLKKYVSVHQNLGLNKENELSVMLSIPKKGNYTIKAFVWDDFKNMNMLADKMKFGVN